MGQLLDLARLACAGRVHTVLAGEVSGPDVFALLSAVAMVAPDVRIGTGIVPATTRSVPLLAMGFSTLASLAPGRVLAGLGVSSRTVVEDWHGLDFPRPLAFMREFVPAFRVALAGERLEIDSAQLTVHGFRLTMAPQPRIGVMLAAMNPGMLRLAGAVGDAVLLTWCPPDEVPALIEQVRTGACQAGRDPNDVEILASFFGYAGDRPALALERYRRFVLAYAMQGTHRQAFIGSIPEIDRAAKLWTADRSAALALVEDAAVHRLCAVGAEAVKRRAADLVHAGVDVPILLPAGASPGDYEGSAATVGVLAAAARSGAESG